MRAELSELVSWALLLTSPIWGPWVLRHLFAPAILGIAYWWGVA